MPSLSELPGKVDREKFVRALQRLGFEISTKGGKGSHYKATWTKNQKCITIPKCLRKDVLKYLLEEIERHSGYTWKNIRDEIR